MNNSVKGISEPARPVLKADWKIENIVATATMHVDGGIIDLGSVTRKHADCEYNPERFPGLIMRFAEPRFTALVFSTGKAVITGLRAETSVGDAVKLVIDKLKKAGVAVLDDSEFKVQNIVASGDVHAPIDLNEATLVLDNSIYEPEVFPGLIYRVKEESNVPKAVFLLFSTGRVVCTGTKNKEDVGKSMERLAEVLEELDLAGGKKPLDEA